MIRPFPFLGHLLLGGTDRQRMRVSQSVLGVPALLTIHLVLLVECYLGQAALAPVAWFIGISLSGCLVFYGLVRAGLGERLSQEPSLSAPQMVYAMFCVAWGYALAGPLRSALLSLMPLILCFGIFALQPGAARALAHFGIGLLGLVLGGLALFDPAAHPPVQEAANWALVSVSMAMIRVLSARVGRMRARLSAQKAELTEALERIRLLATRDTLTGLLNRRAAQEELRLAAAQAARKGLPMVVALADLDHFKLVNDSYGHQAGDRVLQSFARMADQALAGAERVARWGGEEFLFVLPDTDLAQASASLDRLRAAFTEQSVEGVPAGHSLSFSAGVALCSGEADIDDAIERADRAMYAAKLAGRGRTRSLWPEPAMPLNAQAPRRAQTA